jgi:hypothetical protein
MKSSETQFAFLQRFYCACCTHQFIYLAAAVSLLHPNLFSAAFESYPHDLHLISTSAVEIQTTFMASQLIFNYLQLFTNNELCKNG